MQMGLGRNALVKRARFYKCGQECEKLTVMNSLAKQAAHLYFPAIVRSEHDSPLDALVAACVPRPEAMNLVAASWADSESTCLLAVVDGGRPVVVLRTQAGRWAACNAFLGSLHATWQGADRQLRKGRQRQVYVVSVQKGRIHRPVPEDLLADPVLGGEDDSASARGSTAKHGPAEKMRK
ncbi:hypothetical protein [Accumulibacter sp.]|jgi:hypothetical protein|nr:hypothetical protein [Accumulibacter sp.]HRE72780.1 hypothetical protein [Accumulibacter sp.]HRE85439.1 hypothetical protein [Accumulibacter sp.]